MNDTTQPKENNMPNDETITPTTIVNNEPATTEEPDDTTTPKAGREAAKYRRQLRDTEAALTAAQAATEAAQRSLAEHLAQDLGRVRPAALWASGATLADLLDDNGNVDPTKVTAAADTASKTLGLTRTPKPDPTQGGHGTLAVEPTFTNAFRPSA